MYEAVEVKIRGVAPLLCHNGQLADPLNPVAKQMKVVSGKRKKTDADYEELARLEFMGSLYLGDDGRPVIPGELIEAMMVNAAKKNKMGPAFKAGIISDGAWPIEYDGPKSPDKLWEKPAFRDARGVRIGQSRVIRTRPVFRDWSLSFTVMFLPDQLNRADVISAVEIAGRIVGLGDYRPRFGRFEVVSN